MTGSAGAEMILSKKKKEARPNYSLQINLLIFIFFTCPIWPKKGHPSCQIVYKYSIRKSGLVITFKSRKTGVDVKNTNLRSPMGHGHL